MIILKLLIVFLFTQIFAYANESNLSKKTVGLIDTGVYPINKKITAQTLNLSNNIENLHGTSLACILSQNPNINIQSFDHKNTFDGRIESLKSAIKAKVDYILYTSTGNNPSKKEKYLIELALKKGIVVVLSAGNESKNIDENLTYPCSYNIEGALCIGNKSTYSNTGKSIIVIEDDSDSDCIKSLKGTSQSAAIYLKKLIK